MCAKQRSQSLEKGEKAYEFFLDAYQLKRVFQLEDLQQASGYTFGTIEHYVTKKWWWFLAPQQGHYRVKEDFQNHTKEQFLDDIKQKTQPPKRQEPSKIIEIIRPQPQLLPSNDLKWLFVILLCMLWRASTYSKKVRLYGRLYPL